MHASQMVWWIVDRTDLSLWIWNKALWSREQLNRTIVVQSSSVQWRLRLFGGVAEDVILPILILEVEQQWLNLINQPFQVQSLIFARRSITVLNCIHNFPTIVEKLLEAPLKNKTIRGRKMAFDEKMQNFWDVHVMKILSPRLLKIHNICKGANLVWSILAFTSVYLFLFSTFDMSLSGRAAQALQCTYRMASRYTRTRGIDILRDPATNQVNHLMYHPFHCALIHTRVSLELSFHDVTQPHSCWSMSS